MNWFLRLTDGANTWAPIEGNEVAPSAGTLRFVGQVPTLGRTEGVIDGGGEIFSPEERTQVLFWRVLGAIEQTQALIWQNIQTIAPSVGTVRLVGQAPTVTNTANQWAAPTVATIRFVGQAPTATATGDQWAAPTTGTVRFVGNVPSLDPKAITPTTGLMRFVGQVPEISRIVTPTSGTIRFVGWGAVLTDQALDWTVFSDYVIATKEIFWQRSAYVYETQSLAWDINSSVCDIRHRIEQKRITAAARSRSMTIRATQRKLRVRACANQ